MTRYGLVSGRESWKKVNGFGKVNDFVHLWNNTEATAAAVTILSRKNKRINSQIGKGLLNNKRISVKHHCLLFVAPNSILLFTKMNDGKYLIDSMTNVLVFPVHGKYFSCLLLV